jgi:serine protease Do
MANLLQLLNDEMAQVAGKASRSLVQVHALGQGNGSGVIAHADGLVLTNAHVVRSSKLMVVTSDRRELPARLLAYDTDQDLAALVVEGEGLEAMEFGESRKLQPGQLVMALGFPWGGPGAVTTGAVIGSGREWVNLPRSRRDWVGVSLPLRPGNSGGPLIDMEGRLVGLNTMITGPDVAMAVPVHVVKAFLKKNVAVKEPVMV